MGRIGEGEESGVEFFQQPGVYKRKLISIAAFHVTYINERKGYDESYNVIYGAADDGTLWKGIEENGGVDWSQIENISTK